MANLLAIGCDQSGVRTFVTQLKFVLNSRRIRVDQADGPAAAVLLLHTYRYDAILLKPLIGARLGFRFIEQLQRIQPQAGMMVIGDGKLQADCDNALRLGNICWLSQPLEIARIQEFFIALTHTMPIRKHRRDHRNHPSHSADSARR